MKKSRIAVLAASLCAALVSFAFAADREVFTVNTLIVTDNGAIAAESGGSLTISNSTIVAPTITGGQTMSGGATSDSADIGDVDVSTNVDFTVASITITNGQIITLTSTFTELLNTGTANTTTTNTLAAVSSAQLGRLYFIQAAAANTDTVLILESGALVSGGNLSLGASDGFSLIVRDTNILRQVSAVMNN